MYKHWRSFWRFCCNWVLSSEASVIMVTAVIYSLDIRFVCAPLCPAFSLLDSCFSLDTSFLITDVHYVVYSYNYYQVWKQERRRWGGGKMGYYYKISNANAKNSATVINCDNDGKKLLYQKKRKKLRISLKCLEVCAEQIMMLTQTQTIQFNRSNSNRITLTATRHLPALP